MAQDSKTRIIEYLEDLASNDTCLASKLADKSVKTYDKMMTYITSEAKKLCEKGSSSVCIDDDTVYQWARHYWLDYEEKATTTETEATDDEQDSLLDDDTEQTKAKVKPVKVVKKVEEQKPVIEQYSLFDFIDD